MDEEKTEISEEQKTDGESEIVEVKEEKKAKRESKQKAAVKPSWVKIKPEELDKIVIGLGKKGESPAKIGLILRDQYGVPKVKMFGKSIQQILEDNGVSYKTDKYMFESRVKKLKEHISKYKNDKGATRALTKNLWAVHRLANK